MKFNINKVEGWVFPWVCYKFLIKEQLSATASVFVVFQFGNLHATSIKYSSF